MGVTTRRRKRRNNAGELNQYIFYFLIVIVVLWFGASLSFIAILDMEMIKIAEPNMTELLAAKMQPQNNLPKYPINHRASSFLDTPQQQHRPLSDQAISQCHKALWHTLETTTFVLPNNESFVITGDIKDLWLRDSAAQIHPLLLPNVYEGKSLVQMDANLERIVSGLILKSARLIRYDPWANAFSLHNDTKFNKFEKEKLGRHGYIATWNYELDSACYFMRMIYFFWTSFPSHPILRMKEVKNAVMIMIDLWIAEQRHEEDAVPTGELFDCEHCGKPYRYNPKELKRDGKGTETAPSVGLTWSGFRPSDDACVYGYLIPANMFAVVVLGYMEELAEMVWIDEPMMKKARQLKEEIDNGIKTHGIVNHTNHGRIYAYEVDGLGHSLLTDDANVPSLLSIPYLGYEYDEEIFANTKRFILSKDNPLTFHTGHSNGFEYSGIGSVHTNKIPSNIWPMAMIMEALISNNSTEKVIQVDKLLAASSGTGWMHESFNPNNPKKFSRQWFCWPDSLFAELVMSLTEECPKPEHGRYGVREWNDTSAVFDGNASFAAEGRRGMPNIGAEGQRKMPNIVDMHVVKVTAVKVEA
ncbi:hypothetical protein ACHAXR_009358 [Thalassiosira sp. AJA248-18]